MPFEQVIFALWYRFLILWQTSVISILCYYSVSAVILLSSEFTGQSLITADISTIIFTFAPLNLPVLPSQLTWQVLLSQIQLVNTVLRASCNIFYYFLSTPGSENPGG